MDIMRLYDYAESRDLDQMRALWHLRLLDGLRRRGNVPMVELMLAAVVSKSCEHFLSQLCLWIARNIEVVFQRLALAPPSYEGHLGCKERDRATIVAALNTLLAEHISATQQLARDSGRLQFVHLATDKSNVGDLPMQNTFIGYGSSGIVFPAVVQVVSGGRVNQNQKRSH